MLQRLSKEDFDVLVHCGDYSGGTTGHKTLRSTVDSIRQFISKPFVSVIGNHDLWCGSVKHKKPSPETFLKNYESILQTFKKNNVWFLDEDGPYRQNGCTLVGHSGWYQNNNIINESNDFYFLPHALEGDTNRYLQKRAMDGLWRNLDLLNPTDKNIVFVSHFPVIKINNDPGFDKWSWSASLGDALQNQYGIKTFLNGHAHQEHKGPIRWETGSDYHKPKYQIIAAKT